MIDEILPDDWQARIEAVYQRANARLDALHNQTVERLKPVFLTGDQVVLGNYSIGYNFIKAVDPETYPTRIVHNSGTLFTIHDDGVWIMHTRNCVKVILWPAIKKAWHRFLWGEQKEMRND